MTIPYKVVVWTLLGLVFILSDRTSALPTADTSRVQNETGSSEVLRDGTKARAERLARLSQCSLTPMSPTLTSDIREKLDGGARLIHFELTIMNHTGQFPGEMASDVFQPLRLTRSTGRMGRGIMMMKNTYNILSLNTLEYEVEYLNNISLIQNPPGCFSSMDIYDVQEFLRLFLLNDAKGIVINETENFVGNSTQEICNFHINVDREYEFGYFHYECCHLNSDMELICARLIPNIWITAILICVFVLNIIVVFFGPYLVPKSFYEAQMEPAVYDYTLKKQHSVLIKYTNKSTGDKREISYKQFCKKFPNYKEVINSTGNHVGTVFSLNISKLRFNVLPTTLLSSDSSPTGILSSLYDSLFLCKVGKNNEIYSCCTSSIGPCVKYTWQHCLRRLMHAFLLLLLIVPWIVRLMLYYLYEDKEITAMRQAADERGIKSYYVQASFAVRYLTPVHAVFILCYMVIVFDSLVLGLISQSYVKKFKKILTRCFKEMDAYARRDTFDWMLGILVLPLEKIGLFALPFIVIYWIVALIILAPAMLYYLVPTINIWFQLVVHWWAYLCPSHKGLVQFLKNKLGENNLPMDLPMGKRVFEFITVNLCLLTLSSVLFLAVECITFIVEILVYTMVGIILNADVTLKYVSLAAMLLLYTRNSFGSVTKMYSTYTESLINTLRSIEAEQVNKLGICEENIALTPNAIGVESKEITELKTTRNKLTCALHNVILFIDKEMNAFKISKKFYNETIDMNVDGCPGRLFPNFMKALRQLLTIIIFLMFVFLVVSAFGDRYEASGVSQMLATLVGGFLPWIFSNVLFRKSLKSTSIDVNSSTFPTFKRFLHEEAKKFEESWTVANFEFDASSCTEDKIDNKNCDLIVVKPENRPGVQILSNFTDIIQQFNQ